MYIYTHTLYIHIHIHNIYIYINYIYAYIVLYIHMHTLIYLVIATACTTCNLFALIFKVFCFCVCWSLDVQKDLILVGLAATEPTQYEIMCMLHAPRAGRPAADRGRERESERNKKQLLSINCFLIYILIGLFTYLPVYLYTYLPTYHPSIYLSINLFVHLSELSMNCIQQWCAMMSAARTWSFVVPFGACIMWTKNFMFPPEIQTKPQTC